MKSESRLLAEKIYEIEHAEWNIRVEFLGSKAPVRITGDICIQKSADSMFWHLWKEYPDQVRSFWKGVPSDCELSVDNIVTILDAQGWCCI